VKDFTDLRGMGKRRTHKPDSPIEYIDRGNLAEGWEQWVSALSADCFRLRRRTGLSP